VANIKVRPRQNVEQKNSAETFGFKKYLNRSLPVRQDMKTIIEKRQQQE
jgi:hypothetical protein